MTRAQLRSLLTNIEKPAGVDGCWLWRGSVNNAGYASDALHRGVYEALVAPIDPGLEIDHLCRVRACMNPHHMELVSHAENMRRSREQRLWQPIEYCRAGHPLTGGNRRVYSNGPGQPKEVRCYACHYTKATEARSA